MLKWHENVNSAIDIQVSNSLTELGYHFTGFEISFTGPPTSYVTDRYVTQTQRNKPQTKLKNETEMKMKRKINVCKFSNSHRCQSTLMNQMKTFLGHT